MAYVNDFLAGLADLAAIPSDVVSLGMGVVKYPFKKIFTDSENPFAEGVANSWAGQFSQGIRDFNTDLFNSDPESGARRAGSDVGGFALDLFTGGSGKFARAGTKALLKGNTKRAAPLLGRALRDTAITNTAINLGMSALSGEKLTPTEAGIASVAAFSAPGMIRRGTKRLAAKARLLEDQFKPTDAQQFQNIMHYYDKADARGGAVNAARFEGFDVGDYYLATPKDWVKKDPLLGELNESLNALSPDEAQKINRFNQVASELQQRLYAPISIINEPQPNMAAVSKIASVFGMTPNDLPKLRQKLNSMSFDELVSVMNTHPGIFPKTGYVMEGALTPISNASLVNKYNKLKSGLSATELEKQKRLTDLLQKDREANLKAGLISAEESANEARKAAQVGYIPKSALDVREEATHGLLGVTPNATSLRAATKTGMGVARQSNSLETIYKSTYGHALKREFNNKIISLGQSLQAKLPVVLQDTLTKLRQAETAARSARGYQKRLADMDVAYYKNKLEELKKYDFKFSPKKKKNGELQLPTDRDVVSYMINGEQHFFTIPKNYMRSLFEYGDSSSNPLIKGVQRTNNFATQFRTGKWNVLNFGFVKAAYGLWEGLPALTTEAAKRGIDLPAWKVMFEQARQFKNILSNEYYGWLINNIRRRGSYLGHTADDIADLEKKLTDSLFSVYTSPYDNTAELSKLGATRYFDIVNADTAKGMEVLVSRTKQAWHWMEETAPVKFLEMLNTASAESMTAATTKLAKELFPDNPEVRQKFLIDVSKKTSDTRRMPAGVTKTGKTIDTLSKVMPYGKSTTQGLIGKLDYFDIGKNYDMVNNLLHGSRGIDKIINLSTVLAGKTQGEVFDMLWKFVVAPTAMCYFWNNMTPDNAEDYHELTTLARSKNRLLVNFGGRGVHAYFPVDQEWSVLSSMTEALLDSVFGLSDNDPNNPDWEYTDQVLKAAGRALGVEFPVPVNMLTGAIGFEANVNAETLLGGEDSIIEPIRGEGLSGRISYELGEVLGTLGNTISMSLSDRPFNADMLGQIPLITDSWAQQHSNSTSAYVDKIYRQNPQAFPYKDLMTKRKYMEARLRHFKATGRTMDGRTYNMPRQKVIDTINHNINKLNGEMYRLLKEEGSN